MDKVNLVVNDLENYSNEKNLSWMQTYEEIIKKYNIKYEDSKFLNSIVKEITKRGYDIMDNPFRLEKY